MWPNFFEWASALRSFDRTAPVAVGKGVFWDGVVLEARGNETINYLQIAISNPVR